jgi:hypothetical protein
VGFQISPAYGDAARVKAAIDHETVAIAALQLGASTLDRTGKK